MFLKLTENNTGAEHYLNPDHVVRFIAHPAGVGTLIYMTQDAGLANLGELQTIHVHENAEEVFRIISRHEKGPLKPGGGGRGLI